MEQLSELLMDLHPFISAVHLREKQRSAREIYEAVNLFTKRNIPLSKIMINDRIDVALVTGASGVQLAWHSLDVSTIKNHFPQLKVGCSIHTLEEGQKAMQGGADFLLYGHVFPTKSKPGLQPKGLEELMNAAKLLNIPIIAIGGITVENTRKVAATGANGIAVMSGVLEAPDPISAIKAYQNSLNAGGAM
jgi:thiazole tautomerase (transcriptional regulator TenI)